MERTEDELVEVQLGPAKEKLKEFATPNCKRCFGRGYTGRLRRTLILIPCRCVRKNKKIRAGVEKLVEESKKSEGEEKWNGQQHSWFVLP